MTTIDTLQAQLLSFNIMNMLKLAVIIPDSHVPYHDKKAFQILKKVMLHYKKQISEIVILGDFADFYAVNSHGKHPKLLHTLEEEVQGVQSELDWFDKNFASATKVFIEGNHEWRLARFIYQNAPALFGVTSTEGILKLHNRPKWKFIPYSPQQSYQVMGSKLTARHEPLASSVKATASKALCSLVYGHIHRIEESHLVGLDGTNHVCFSVGWLGNKKLDEVYGYVKGHHQWQLGFGLAWVDTSTGYFYHQKVHILDNYSCVIDGKVFKP
ncbi:MAG: hypothetical protein ACK5UJ_00275 [Pseudobdellovibrionaceae bacterium]